MGAKNTRWFGLPARMVSLALLTIQFSAVILLLHYSRVMPASDEHRYLPSTAVFLVELLKLVLCLTISLYEVSVTTPRSMTAASLFSNLGHAIFAGDSWKMAVPAFLYTMANSLQYVGISNLDAATFQVVYQLKVLVTAIFSVIMLQKSISTRQWISLVLLMVGVAVVSLPDKSLVSSHPSRIYSSESVNPLRQRLSQLYSGSVGGSNIIKRSATYEGIAEDEWALNNNAGSDALSGILATIGTCICSGLGGVFFEKVMKDSYKPPSLWIRNVQLSTYALFPSLFFGVIFLDGEIVSKYGFFHGYNWVVVLSIVIQSLGGILAAFVIFYADNISKNFALSISMVLSSLASYILFDFTATTNFMLGFAIVVFSTYLYSISEKPRQHLPPIRIGDYEKINGEQLPTEIRDMSIMMPKTPLANEGSFTSSRPGSPSRLKRKGEHLGYFTKQND